MTIYTTRDTATQASLGRLRELVLVWVLVGARALLHLLLASPLLVAVVVSPPATRRRRHHRRRRSPRPGPAVVAVSPFTAARCCRASCFISPVRWVGVLSRPRLLLHRPPRRIAPVVLQSPRASAEAAACCVSVFRPSVVFIIVVVFISIAKTFFVSVTVFVTVI